MIYIILFLFGSAIGSFLNVLIYRIEQIANGKSPGSIISGRSYCPHCKHQIRFYDNIPLLSFFILRGRCRDCKEKISWQYPLVEFSVGILFIAIYFLVSELRSGCFGVSLLLASCFLLLMYSLIVFSGLLAIFVYDFKHYIIPNKIIYPLILVAVIFNLFSLFSASWRIHFSPPAGGFTFGLSLIIPVFFLSLIIISRGKWMGMGDVKLAFFMALFLGWPNILVAVFSAFWLGTLVGLPLVVFGKKKMQSQIPFGPFLIIGIFIAFFWGSQIIDWYLRISL